ncbi:pilus assembly protein TadG-related protein [Streptomyces sp. SYSU K217416]
MQRVLHALAPRHREAGQAFPIYITVVASLLFLAFAYFAVGQAAATRNGAQGAADAAALAAAQEARDQLGRDLLGSVLNPENWSDLFNGEGFGYGESCAEAERFAEINEARVLECDPYDGHRDGFTVQVESLDTFGESVIPGTEDMKSVTEATAVIEPLCTFESRPEPEPGESDDPENGEDEDEPVSPGTLTCNGRDLPIDPANDDWLPDVADLFSVRLIDAD